MGISGINGKVLFIPRNAVMLLINARCDEMCMNPLYSPEHWGIWEYPGKHWNIPEKDEICTNCSNRNLSCQELLKPIGDRCQDC